MNLYKVIILSIITCLPIYSQREFKDKVYDHAVRNMNEFIELNAELSKVWPVLNEIKPAPEDADEWKEKTDKIQYLER